MMVRSSLAYCQGDMVRFCTIVSFVVAVGQCKVWEEFMAFKEVLKRRRIKKGYSLQELASLMDVSKAHIWDLEQGRAKNPSLEVLQKLSKHLEVPISTLVGENPEENKNNDESVVMYRELQTLDDEDRETIKLMMDRLKKRT